MYLMLFGLVILYNSVFNMSIKIMLNGYIKISLALLKTLAVWQYINMDFSLRLAAFRKKLKMNQIDLAETLGVSIDTVRRWEAGTREPRLAQLKDMAELFGLTIDGLLGSNESVCLDQDAEAENISKPKPERKVKAASASANIIFEFGEGAGKVRLELPPTDETYKFLEDRIAPYLKPSEVSRSKSQKSDGESEGEIKTA